MWSLLSRGGVAAASYRAVATETGLSVGSVRYYAATQDLLVLRAMRVLLRLERRRAVDGIDVRGRRSEAERDPVGVACRSIAGLLPTDPAAVVEARAWAAFAFASGALGADEAARELLRDRDDELRGVCEVQIRALAHAGEVDAGRDLALERDRLWVLVEGMTWRCVVAGTPSTTAAGALRAHLAGLAAPPSRDRDRGRDYLRPSPWNRACSEDGV